MPNRDDFVGRMRALLAVSDPDLDTSVGSIPRKMIDAVAEMMAEVTLDSHLIDYQYDIDSRTGAALDEMVRLFGFARLPARRATGEITVERAPSNDKTIVIPVGTQFSTDDAPPIAFATIVPAVMLAGDTTITVPVQALTAGSNGNITANTIKKASTPIAGVGGFTNLTAFTGGSDAEDDDALRSRFKRTIFRNLAGTEDMYLGVSLENPYALAANVIGPVKRHREQLELVNVAGDWKGDSTIVNAKYVYDPLDYPGSAFFGTDIDGDAIFNPLTTWEMTFTTNPDGTVTPTVTSLAHSVIPLGIYELDFSYVPRASRNDPANGITNRVDVWVDGVNIVEATEIAKYDTAKAFNNTPGDPYYRQNYRRNDTEDVPTADNLLIPLHFSPIVDASINDSIVISGETYYEGTDYFAVNEITAEGMSPQSRSGLEWVVAANGGNVTQPANSTLFSLTYTYNNVPLSIQKALQNWRLITQDVWVHASMPILLNYHFVVLLTDGANVNQVKADMIPPLRNHLASIGFGNQVQASDILAIAHAVAGVDAVRFTRQDEASGSPLRYGIQRVNSLGTVMDEDEFWDNTYKRVKDVFVDDDSTAKLNDIFITVKAPNTWGGA